MPVNFEQAGDAPSQERGRPPHVVAVASSAGGLAALSLLLSTLPADFPAPILIVQHLDPHHRSWMAEILSRRTSLRVSPARDGEKLAPGAAFVARRTAT